METHPLTVKKPATKRKYSITIMRPIFQAAILEIEAATSDEAIEIAQEREPNLKNDDWKGPWERAIYEATENDSLQMFHSIRTHADPSEPC